jgi:hypothetical protein
MSGTRRNTVANIEAGRYPPISISAFTGGPFYPTLSPAAYVICKGGAEPLVAASGILMVKAVMYYGASTNDQAGATDIRIDTSFGGSQLQGISDLTI